jgi:hypothetical protein
MTNGEIIQRVLNLYSKGIPSDDARLSRRHVYSKLNSVRSRLIVQKLNKKQDISRFAYYTVPCIELVKVPIHECDCIPALGNYISRSKYQLPTVINDIINGDVIESVTGMDGTLNFSASTWTTAKYIKGNKFTANSKFFYIKNKYLYVSPVDEIELVTMTALWEDPVLAMSFTSYCNCDNDVTTCTSPLDMEFVTDPDLIEPILQLTIEELVGVFTKTNEDITNDTKDTAIHAKE